MTLERPMFPPAREIETVESYPIQDTFCSALARVERIGSCRRLIFTVPDLSDSERPQRLLVAKLIVPAEGMAIIAAAMLAEVPEAIPLALARPASVAAN
jgi:hypothetical protein